MEHRPLGVLWFRSRDEYVASVRTLLDLRSDARLRVDHVLDPLARFAELCPGDGAAP